MRLPVLLGFLAAACSFDPALVGLDGGVGAAGGDGRAATDAFADARAAIDALSLGPFGEPVRTIDTLDDDDDPSLTDDQLELFFGSYGGGFDEDIWTSTRDDTSQTFVSASYVSELATSSNETTGKVSGDGLTIVFARTDPNADLYIATRPTRSDDWGDPEPIAELNTGGSEWSPYLLADGLTLVYCANAGSEEELYVATRPDPQSDFGSPTHLASLGTDGDECDPMMPTPDVIYFSRGYAGTSDTDIFTARRVSRDGWDFTDVSRLDELTSSARDRDPWVSPDQRTIWFASSRGLTVDIFVAKR
jgi:hypothetical protein